MLTLYVEAPFAVCRTFTAGWYRPTATFLTPSAAYGLLLNLAGIEMRLREEDERHPGHVPTTLTQADLPSVRLALGVPTTRRKHTATEPTAEPDCYPRVQSLYQQLHNYPVGSSGEARISSTFGSKYNIAPVRREILVSLRAIIVMDGNVDLEKRVIQGLAGQGAGPRYGLPFIGDNSFLPDRVNLLDRPPTAHWYERVTPDESSIHPRASRLTTWIDRADLSRTRSALYAPGNAVNEVPPLAWTHITPN